MNTLFAASLFDNPWVIVVIVLVGALSQWLMKRRQRNQADNQPDGDESLPSTDQPQARSQRQLDLQDALRELMGGEPAPRAPQPPPIPPVMRDAQPSKDCSSVRSSSSVETPVACARAAMTASSPAGATARVAEAPVVGCGRPVLAAGRT